MESRLWNIITTPAMILTVGAGIAMLCLNPPLLHAGWMQVKLAFVLGLLIYHFICARILKGLKNGVFRYTSTQLRLWNEVATMLLVAIVFTVVLKTPIHWFYSVIAFISLGVILMLAVKIYKKRRLKQK
jgi:putative membrane protein